MGKDFFRVAVRLHVLEDVRYFAVRADQESGAGDTHDLLAVHVLFLEDAKLLRDLFLVVGQQGIRQLFFFFKLLLGGWFVGRNAQDNEAGLL